METVTDFIFLGSRITADCDCSHEIKRRRHYFANKGPSSQSYGFSSIMYGCDSWTIKKVEHRRIDAFELWCWRRLLRVLDSMEIQPVNPKGNQSSIFIGRTDVEAETPTLWPPDAKNCLIWRPWCWERLKAGEGDDRGWDGWVASLTQWTWV